MYVVIYVYICMRGQTVQLVEAGVPAASSAAAAGGVSFVLFLWESSEGVIC